MTLRWYRGALVTGALLLAAAGCSGATEPRLPEQEEEPSDEPEGPDGQGLRAGLPGWTVNTGRDPAVADRFRPRSDIDA